MVVTVDIGESHNIHPADKQDVGHRLALWARMIVYGDSIEDSGPLFQNAVPMGRDMGVSFTHGGGLRFKGTVANDFKVAADDEQFVPAIARIEDEKIYARSFEVIQPRYVRLD